MRRALAAFPARTALACAAALLALAASGAAHAVPWYFQAPASRMAQDIDRLHQYVMWVIIVIFKATGYQWFWGYDYLPGGTRQAKCSRGIMGAVAGSHAHEHAPLTVQSPPR